MYQHLISSINFDYHDYYSFQDFVLCDFSNLSIGLYVINFEEKKNKTHQISTDMLK